MMEGGAQIPDFEAQKSLSGQCPTALQAGGPTAPWLGSCKCGFPHPSPPGTSGWSFVGVRRQVPSGHALCPAAQPACEEAHRAGGLGSGPPQVCPVEPEPGLPASSSIWNPFRMAGHRPRRPRRGALAQPRYPHRCRSHPFDSKHRSNSAGSAASGSQEPAQLVHLHDGVSWKIRW